MPHSSNNSCVDVQMGQLSIQEQKRPYEAIEAALFDHAAWFNDWEKVAIDPIGPPEDDESDVVIETSRGYVLRISDDVSQGIYIALTEEMSTEEASQAVKDKDPSKTRWFATADEAVRFTLYDIRPKPALVNEEENREDEKMASQE